jgi:hypothetical protein
MRTLKQTGLSLESIKEIIEGATLDLAVDSFGGLVNGEDKRTIKYLIIVKGIL